MIGIGLDQPQSNDIHMGQEPVSLDYASMCLLYLRPNTSRHRHSPPLPELSVIHNTPFGAATMWSIPEVGPVAVILVNVDPPLVEA